jgi:alpha/beta hydrolase family protein
MLKLRIAALVAAFLFPLSAEAEVISFEVTGSEPAFEGRSFGSVGTYVKITGRAVIAVDPADPRNAIIADIDKAPRGESGKVEATADVVLIRPADPRHSNGTLLVDIANRGLKLAPQLFDDSPQPGANNAEKSADAGTGFLYDHGYTLAWIGWQADIPSKPGQIALAVPVVTGITGPARDEFVFDNTTSPATATLSSTLGDPASLKVTVRAKWDAERETPTGLSIRATGPQTVEITRPASDFDAGALYEVTYTAKDPAVLGLGFAATRDVVSFLRRSETSDNPIVQGGGNAIKRAIGFGVSQSGRYLRDFLYLGFNEDLGGGLVFDGLMPHVAGSRRMAVNYRFGQPGRNARHPQDPAWQDDLFPFTYDTLVDPVSGRRDGLMQRCRLTATCPKVIQTDSEHEWWASHASLVVTDTAGNHIDLPRDVRMYMIAGSPHYADPDAVMKKAPTMALPVNPNHAGMPMRALLTAMQAWITTGVEPPASRVPMRASGTLVDAASAVPRNIPGLPYTAIHTDEAFTDTSVFPPKILGLYPVFVPRADNDGISIAGIRMLPLAVPRATYTGWNPRAQGYGAGALFPLQGAVVPFAATKAEREAAGDPRLSIAERYADDAAYVEAVKKAAAEMVAERLLLPEDAIRAVELARQDKLSKLH